MQFIDEAVIIFLHRILEPMNLPAEIGKFIVIPQYVTVRQGEWGGGRAPLRTFDGECEKIRRRRSTAKIRTRFRRFPQIPRDFVLSILLVPLSHFFYPDARAYCRKKKLLHALIRHNFRQKFRERPNAKSFASNFRAPRQMISPPVCRGTLLICVYTRNTGRKALTGTSTCRYT